LPVYDEEAREGKSEAKSMQDLETGRCCGYHTLLVQQTSSQTCREIPDIAVIKKKKKKEELN
jgi:hypothetical protein